MESITETIQLQFSFTKKKKKARRHLIKSNYCQSCITCQKKKPQPSGKIIFLIQEESILKQLLGWNCSSALTHTWTEVCFLHQVHVYFYLSYLHQRLGGASRQYLCPLWSSQEQRSCTYVLCLRFLMWVFSTTIKVNRRLSELEQWVG